MAGSRRIHYRLGPPGQPGAEITVAIDTDTLACLEPVAEALPWTALAHHQCAGCPLDPATVPLCPFAARLAAVVRHVGEMLSFETVDVDIESGARRIHGRVPVQTAARSLIGLIAAVSGCPRTAFLRPLAWFHLPLADEEETLFRAASSYLLGQYLKARAGSTPDWTLDGLAAAYRELHTVNVAMAQRLRDASGQDAAVNAVVLLDLFAKAVPWSIEESLESLGPLFAGADAA
ncbi:MAG: hypothetical protein KJ787_02395 [Gammaproteobacteria bacterium]|nr:hypothetical protein [Gammaproteobacteria bacterium]MBU1645166.1 hypothetical protein [Gammaproteobacteria bacterium]MBU1973403.1 hypothetical protein [Gammaproteobacteria bacterium]